jgi:predicted ATP-dependent serine protease
MAKAKRMYGCTECGATFPKWAGQCGECGAWNTLTETMIESGGAAAPSGRTGPGSRRRSRPWPKSASKRFRVSPRPVNWTGCWAVVWWTARWC